MRLTRAQREILTLMAANEPDNGDIVEDYDHPGWIFLGYLEPQRYVSWETVRILQREGLVFDASTAQERYRWKITEAGRVAVSGSR